MIFPELRAVSGHCVDGLRFGYLGETEDCVSTGSLFHVKHDLIGSTWNMDAWEKSSRSRTRRAASAKPPPPSISAPRWQPTTCASCSSIPIRKEMRPPVLAVAKTGERPTLYQVLLGDADIASAITTPTFEGLDRPALGQEPCGSKSGAVEIFQTANPDFANKLEPIRDQYHFILIDCPASAGSADPERNGRC